MFRGYSGRSSNVVCLFRSYSTSLILFDSRLSPVARPWPVYRETRVLEIVPKVPISEPHLGVQSRAFAYNSRNCGTNGGELMSLWHCCAIGMLLARNILLCSRSQQND